PGNRQDFEQRGARQIAEAAGRDVGAIDGVAYLGAALRLADIDVYVAGPMLDAPADQVQEDRRERGPPRGGSRAATIAPCGGGYLAARHAEQQGGRQYVARHRGGTIAAQAHHALEFDDLVAVQVVVQGEHGGGAIFEQYRTQAPGQRWQVELVAQGAYERWIDARQVVGGVQPRRLGGGSAVAGCGSVRVSHGWHPDSADMR